MGLKVNCAFSAQEITSVLTNTAMRIIVIIIMHMRMPITILSFVARRMISDFGSWYGCGLSKWCVLRTFRFAISVDT